MVLTVLCLSVNLLAATVIWSPTSEGIDWNTPAAWTGGIPAAGDIANLTSSYSCELNTATAALNELNLGNASTAILNVNSGGTINMGGTGHINIGRYGHSTVNVYDGGSIVNIGGARISLDWVSSSVVNQYGGYVEPHTLLSLAPNSAYNISGGKLAILGSKGNAALRIGNNNPNPDAFFNLSGTGEVEIIGTGAFQMGFDSRNGGKGTFNQSGGYLNMSACDTDMVIGRDLKTVGKYNLSGGTVTVKKNAFVGHNGSGELNITGGTFNCEQTLRLAIGQNGIGKVTISGGSVNIGGYIQAGAPVTDPNQYAELNIIGSGAANITAGGRLDFKDKYNANINFVFDDGGITPIHTTDFALLQGCGITFDAAEGAALALGSEIDVIISDTGIESNANTTFTNNSDIYDFSYAVVDLVPSGKALRVTVTGINYPDCAAAIAAGIYLPADINLDCVVDLADFAIMASQWMDCNDPSGVNCQ